MDLAAQGQHVHGAQGGSDPMAAMTHQGAAGGAPFGHGGEKIES